MAIERVALPGNLLDRVEALEAQLHNLMLDAATLQTRPIADQEGGSLLSGWVATGSAFRDVLGRVILDAELPGITVGSGGIIRSADFESGMRGFRIDGGQAEFNNIIARGTIEAEAGSIGGWAIGPDVLTGGNARLESDGRLALGTGDEIVILDATSAAWRLWAGDSDGDDAPFRVSRSGEVWAEAIHVRGTIEAATFAAEGMSAAAGSLIVSHSAGTLATDYATGGTLEVESPPSGAWLFSDGDIVRLGDGLHTTWVRVQRTATVNRYTTSVLQGDDPATYATGTVAIDYGQGGDGWLLLTAEGAESPRLSILTHGGAPWSDATEHVRLGLLEGLSDPIFGSLSGWGLWAENAYLTGGIRAMNGSIEGVLDMMDGGEIRLGIGTVGSDFTGLRLYRAPGGIYRLDGVNGGTVQAYFDSDGSIRAGQDAVTINRDGIRLDPILGKFGSGWLVWEHDDTVQMEMRISVDLGTATGAVIATPLPFTLDVPDVLIKGTQITYNGDLRPVRGGTTHTGYVVVPMIPGGSNDAWDGDPISEGTYTVSVADWGVPSDAVMVHVRIAASWATPGSCYAFVKYPGGGGPDYGPTADGGSTAAIDSAVGWVNVKNGEIEVVIYGDDATHVWLTILAYAI